MPGVMVSLEGESAARVRDLWSEAEQELGLALMPPGSIPHITLHLAEAYDLPALDRVLKSLARSESPFSVRAAGYGVFNGEQPVLYIAVVRTSRLTVLQRVLFQEAAEATRGLTEYFHPDRWMPHITIAMPGLTPEMIARLVPWLNDRDLSFEVPMLNLTAAEEGESGPVIHFSHRLAG